MVGSVCHVKRFTTRSINSRVADYVRPGAEVAETTVKILLCCGFRRTSKAMGQVYQCWRRTCREINAIFQVRILHVIRLLSICDVFTDFLVIYFFRSVGSLSGSNRGGSTRDH
jgi:hypothetical protein